jgi:hypothetical protein
MTIKKAKLNLKQNEGFFDIQDASQDFNTETILKKASVEKVEARGFLRKLNEQATKMIEDVTNKSQDLIKKSSIDERVLAYMAGFLDGDGTIQVSTTPTNPNLGYRFPFKFQLTVTFIQKSSRVSYLEDIKDKLGGVGNIRYKSDGVCEYNITNNETIKDLLTLLLPYLRLKKRQGALALLFIETTGKGMTVIDFLKRAMLVDEIASYNDSKSRINTASKIKQTLIEKGLLSDQELKDFEFI